MRDATARAVSTFGIWLAVAVVLAGGVFQHGWTGDAALMILMAVVLTVCGSAAGATVAVWRGSSTAGVVGGAGPGTNAEPGAPADGGGR